MKFTPFRIALIYLAFALFWILTTDIFLESIVDDVALLTQLQIIKGWFYVTFTAIALYFMMRSYEKDIKSRKQDQENIEANLRVALKAANMGAWNYDVENDKIYVFESHQKILGLEGKGEPTNEKVFGVILEEDLLIVKKAVSDTIEKGDAFDVVYRIRKNGEIRWIHSVGTPVKKLGKVVSVNGVISDITSEKERQQELKMDKKRLQLIFDSLPVFINEIDEDMQVRDVNMFFTERLGYEKEDILKDNFLREMAPNQAGLNEALSHISNADGTWKDFDIQSKSGEVLKTSWTTIKISEDRFLGIGVDITERDKLEKLAKESRERLSLSVKGGGVGLWDFYPQDDLIKINDEWAEMIGYSVAELEPITFQKWKSLTHPDDVAETERILNLHFSGNLPSYTNEIRMRHKDGHWVWIHDKGEVFEVDENGDPLRVLGVHIDITQRKNLEEIIEKSRERLEVATNSANVGLWEWHPKTGKTVFDENWAQIVGYSIEELEPINIETWNKLVHPDDLEKFEQTVAEYFTGKMDMYECEVRMRHKDGHWVWVLDRGKTVEWDEDGKPVRMAGTHVEISEQKENERLLREAQRVANMGTYLLNIETKEVKTSRILDEIFGMPKEEKITLNKWEQLMHPDFKVVISNFERAMEKGVPFEAEYKIIRKSDKQERWIYEKADVEYDDFGAPEQMVGVMQDITKVKEYEESLEKERNLFKITSNLVSDVVWDFDIKTNKIWWSEGIEHHFGFKREDISNGVEFWANHIHPDDMERVVTSFQNGIDGNRTLWEEEYTFLTANGEERTVLDRGYIFRDEEGKGIRMTGAILDLTEQRESEAVLQYQANLLESISEAVISGSSKADIKSWNRAAEAIFGYSEEEAIGQEINTLLKTEYENVGVEDVRSQLAETGEWQGESIHYTKDNKAVRALSSVKVQYDSSGELTGWVAVIRDITEMKKVQERLTEEQNRFVYAASVVSDAVWDAIPDEGTVWWSEGFKTNFGYDIPSIEKGGEVWENAIHPEDRERVLANMNEVEESGETSWSEDYRFYRADGTIAYVLDQSFIMRDENGNVRRIIGAMNDITAEKVMEEELRRSEEYYRLLFEQSPIPMWIYEPTTFRFELANSAAVKKYGYSKEEFRHMSVFDLHPESDQEGIREEARKNLQHDQTGFDEWVHVTKTGEQIVAEISGTYIYRGKDQKRLLIANDITRLRKAESQAVSAVVEGEERERKRIANELHDGLGQYLSAANMNLETVYEDLPEIDPLLTKTFQNGLKMLAHAISETRSISQNLLPKSIQDYGLKLAVQSLINNLKSVHDLNFTLYQNYNTEDISGKIQINLYRIIQESLTNAIRHSEAKSIHLQLNHSNDDFICTIEDDGKGFDQSDIQSPGLGLQSIKTRVAAMAGNFDIDSRTGKGTLLTIIIPIKDSTNYG